MHRASSALALRDAFRMLVALVVAATPLLSSCGEPCDKPCVEWVEVGDTYSVELVQHLEIEMSNHGLYPISAPAGSGWMPCGSALDLSVGQDIDILAANRDEGSCRSSCYYVNIQARVPGVTVIDPGPRTHGVDVLVEQSEVRIGDACTGSYELSLAPVWEGFRRMSNEYIATDYVFFRAFSAHEPAACAEHGSVFAGGGHTCWDAWAVRIRGASGVLLTDDVSPPSAPAQDEDGGS